MNDDAQQEGGGCRPRLDASHQRGGVAIALPLSQRLLPQYWLASRKPVCRIPHGGARALIRSKNLTNMELERTRDGWQLNTTHEHGTAHLSGDEGVRALGYALSRINTFGATRNIVAQGISMIEEAGGPDALLERAARIAPAKGGENSAMVARYPAPVRVALELASRERRDRFELENEIALLQHEWREAEEIASITERILA